jgi:general secretion pathway protein A
MSILSIVSLIMEEDRGITKSILDYFGLKEHPFRIGPDPRFLYLTEQVTEAIAKCEYMATERVGPIYIYGPIGAGKTSILKRINEILAVNERYKVSYIVAPKVERANAFLRMLLEEFEVEPKRSYDQSLRNFDQFLTEAYQAKQVPVLLVDEAQNLNRQILQLIHYLLNFETATVKLLQVILVGQEELGIKILKYRELASRMFPIAIRAMSAAELKEMIAFRWMVAGGKGSPFDETDPEIYKVLYAYSKGLPRDAIKVCDELLRELMSIKKKQASSRIVEKICRELNLTN